MRSQPPDRNNPANPLLKVAALQIDKEPFGKSPDQAKAVINLTFKKSRELQGHARGQDDRPITVTFSLALSRASLRLDCLTDTGESPSGLVKIKRVTFSEPLLSRTKIETKKHYENTSGVAISGDAEASVKTAIVPTSASIGAKVKGSFKRAKGENKKEATHREEVNIRATFAGNQIHWEIEPSRIATEGFLSGEVFRLNRGGQSSEACVIARTDGSPIATLTLSASVYVSMADMAVDNIVFTDDLGNVLGLNQVDKSESRLTNMMNQQEAKS